jgi:hypothetical protein
VKVIASQTHNPQAWRALVLANYNCWSEYAKWLIAQPEAMPVFIEVSDYRRSDAVRGRMLEMMGYAIQPCRTNPRLPVCAKAEQLRAIIRRHAENGLPTTPDAIIALGMGGTMADIPLLESLRNRFTEPPTELTKKVTKPFNQRSGGSHPGTAKW